MMVQKTHIHVPTDKIADFCSKWKISEFSLFGSVLRDDFNPTSDIDILIDFDDDAGWSLYDLVDMQDELKTILGRNVDLVEKKCLHNPFRRHSILKTRQVIYANE